MPLSKDLMEVLACPKCKGELAYQELEKRLICDHCRLAYAIKEEIPVMLVDQAQSF
ncbi:MAG: Trm112 family protein [Elusimicrobia bacterium]|nr:Trm112 family protein [Elusimicrobiota bacterium]